MLKDLIINNIAVIENAEVVFFDGFNVLTGETGAGKSIIVDSINAVLGERTSRDIIRGGCDKAQVVAVFQDVSNECEKVFSDFGIESDEGQYIVQRTITAAGKNNCRINGIPVNTVALKEVGKHLINIHGQHDNQQLLSVENHSKFLDAFAENSQELNDYKDSFNRFKQVRKELSDAIENEKAQKDRVDVLNFQITELESANITVGEAESLKERILVLENGEKLSNALLSIIGTDLKEQDFLTELESAENAFMRLSSISKDIDEFKNKLSSSILELKSLRLEAKQLDSALDFSPEELEKLQNRLDFLYTLMRKYDGNEQSLLDFLANAKEQLNKITLNRDRIVNLEQQIVTVQNELIEKAKRLSETRASASKRLSTDICEVLNFLDMSNVAFCVDIKQGSYTSNGTDRVEFLISTNKGQSLMSLSKIASGGELSRIMLAIKSVLADKDNVDTLIFDEIDTGISGRAARKIGIQLKRVSKLRQVLCITHLAQIAALADNHLLISKSDTEDSTKTSVKSLNGNERILEVARIMSGSEITDNLFNTAKELIEENI